MKTTDLLLNMGIVLAGPLLSVFMIQSGKEGNIGETLLMVVAGAAIALVVSWVVNYKSKRALINNVIISSFISEVIYIIIIIVSSVGDPKSLMWLPVILIFLSIYSFPTALSVSYGAGRIIRDMNWGNSEN